MFEYRNFFLNPSAESSIKSVQQNQDLRLCLKGTAIQLLSDVTFFLS